MEVLGYSLEVHLHHCRQKGQIPFMATKTFQLSIGRNMFMLPGMSPKLQMFLDGLWFVIFFAWVAALSLTKVLLYRFVKVVKAKTPKITYYSDQAKCLLMENSPDPDCEAIFYHGMYLYIFKTKFISHLLCLIKNFIFICSYDRKLLKKSLELLY